MGIKMFRMRHQLTCGSLNAWTDVDNGRPNTLEILTDSQYRTLYAGTDSYADRPYFDDTYIMAQGSTLPSGLLTLVNKRLLSKATRRVLARYANAWQNGLGVDPLDMKPKFRFHNYASSSRILTQAEPSMEKCLLLALFFLPRPPGSTSQRINVEYNPGTICHYLPRNKLAQILPLVVVTDDTHDCIVWLWMILVASYRCQSRILQKGVSILREFQRRFPDYTWDLIELAILPRFFWDTKNSFTIGRLWMV
jgi:hypothetical protein